MGARSWACGAMKARPLLQANLERIARSGPHLRNASWSAAEFLFFPCLLLIATPFLVAVLGTHQYGLWMLVNALTGMGGVAALGMGPATIKFVSAHGGRRDLQAAAHVARQSLAITLIGALVVAGGLVLGSPWLAGRFFSAMGDAEIVVKALIAAALILFLQQTDAVYASVMKGMERFGVAARIEISAKFVTIAGNVAVAALTRDLFAVLAVTIVVAGLGIWIKAVFASRILGRAIYLPRWSGATFRELREFGLWSWLQGISGALFQSLDRLLVGSLLGANAVAAYSICLQLAQLVHAIPAAAMAVLFPLTSRKIQTSEWDAYRTLRKYGIVANLLLVFALGAVLISFASPVLALWINADFAQRETPLLVWLVVAYVLLGLNVAPHYMLLGHGEARFVSLTNMAGGVAGSIAAFALIPAFGVNGAAMSRMFYGPAIMLNFIKLFGTGKGR